MADVLKDRDVKKLRSAIDKIFKSTKDERDKMEKYWKHFRGKIWDEELLNRERPYSSKAFINMLFSVVQQTAPMLTDNNPIAHVVPRFGYMEMVGWAYTKALHYVWDVADINRQVLYASMDALVKKIGILKVYYDPTKTYGSDLCVQAVDPVDFFIAPGYDTIWDAPMVGMRTWKPVSWIKARFPDVKEVKEGQEITEDDSRTRAYRYGEETAENVETKFARLYEVWLKDDESMEDMVEEDEETGKKRKTKKKKYPYGKFVYFTDEQSLGVEPQSAMHGLPPYVEIKDYDIPHQFLGQGEADQIDGLNQELNLQLQALLDYARRHHAPNYETDSDAGIDIDQLKRDLPKGNQVFSVTRSLSDARSLPVIRQIPDGQLNPEILRLLNVIMDIIDEQSGVTDVTKGIAGKTERQSATEVATLLESSHTRTRQRIRNQEWTVKRLNYLLVRLMQQYYTDPRSVYWKEDNSMNYMTFGSSKAQIGDMMMPNQEMMDRIKYAPGRERNELPPEELQKYEDYKRFIEAFHQESDTDPILFDFEITVETNSSLPRDRQNLANLILRLAQLQITDQSPVDVKAVLDILRIPDKDGILERKESIAKQYTQGANNGRSNANGATDRQSNSPQPLGGEPY